MKEIFACHGIPNNVVSDNGPQFVSEEFAQFASIYGFSHTTSSPQGNGLVERTVQSVKALLKKSLFAKEDYHLALLGYRSTSHETTSVSPVQLLMGLRLRTTLPPSSSY
jgi:transposase InsO family protein